MCYKCTLNAHTVEMCCCHNCACCSLRFRSPNCVYKLYGLI